MAKSKSVAISKRTVLDGLLADLNMKYKGQVVQWLSDTLDKDRFSTGIDHLDMLLGGGIPKGCIVEIFGLKQSGKTSLALTMAGQCESVLYIDGERKITKAWAELFGAHGEYVIAQPSCLEQALELVRHFIHSGTQLIIIDSLPSLPSRKEQEETNYDKNTGMAHTAGILSRKLGVLNNLCHEMQATLVIVNQLRANVNAPPFGEQYHTFGGLMLPSIAAVRISVARKSWLKDARIGVYGQEVAYLIDKSSVSAPRKGGDAPLLFDHGFVDQHAHTNILPVLRDKFTTARKQTTVITSDDVSVQEVFQEVLDE